MKIRLGYVAISMKIGKKVTSSSSVTFKNYTRLNSEEERINKLKKVALSNLNDLEKILNYNVENSIHFYRITSALIPLVTHPEVGYWGHRQIFKKDFEAIGRIIKKNNIKQTYYRCHFALDGKKKKLKKVPKIKNKYVIY